MGAARGRPYQQLVAEVARVFDPGARVTEGEWVAGPDGRLDMDVAIRAQIDGQEVLAVIECKDFDPKSTGKVGREFIDALDSKRHDLGASIAIICSNSGFTVDALRKAKRKGIGAISVLCRGDSRARAEVLEHTYLRRIRFSHVHFAYHGVGNIASRLGGRPTLHLIRFDGISLDDWLQHRATLVAVANPLTAGPLRAAFEFKEPLTFSCDDGPIVLRAVEVIFTYSTEWLCQTVRLDAALGMYDYLRGRVQLAPGANKYVIEGVNWNFAQPCDPPEDWPMFSKRGRPGEIDFSLITYEGLNIETLKLPRLEPYVVPRDLELELQTNNDARLQESVD